MTFERVELEYLFSSVDKNLVTTGTREGRLKAFMLDKLAQLIEQDNQKQAEGDEDGSDS